MFGIMQAKGGSGARVGLSVLASFMAFAIAGQASASCHIAAEQQKPATQSNDNPMFTPAVFRSAQFQPAVFAPASDLLTENASIVGLWEFEVRAAIDEGPFLKGDLLDWGLATWHDDGTEIQFSAGRPYDAGDVCMGVWKQTGHNKFHLNHMALGKDLATGANFDGVTNIRADVTVDHAGNRFTGSYQIIQYFGNPNDGTEFDQSTEQYRFIATVTANRVSPN
jgi:hypothetical protein